ncbi:MAG: mechanosensitive ion channel domain-containing protein [Candidatus Competibacteraceae bacterium]|jgi:small-conductance mechanosensitive channel|nr:mechanosensitive ion channel domain-containing protein [Candidatus Competibacteraceae bacterium]
MVRTVLLAIVISIACIVATTAQAAKIPFVEEALKKELGDLHTAMLPEPAALQADWWRYFDAEDETLENRINTTLVRLDELLTELPQETTDTAKPLVALIRANLQALPQVRAQPAPEFPSPPTYKESYTLPEFLNIARRLRTTADDIQTEKDDIATTEKNLNIASRQIDTLMAAYLNLAKTEPNRVLRGLNIMAERSGIAITKERLRLRKATLLADEMLVNQLTDEQKIAAQRLVADHIDRFKLNSAIAVEQVNLAQAQERFIKEQSRAQEVVGDTLEDRVTANYRQQRAVQAAATEAVARVELLKLEAQKTLVVLLLDTGDIDAKALREQLEEWNTRLINIRQQVTNWTDVSMRERQRAGGLLADKPLAGTPLDGDLTGAQVAASVKLINEDRIRLAQETLVALLRLRDAIIQADLVLNLADEQLAHREGFLKDWLARLELAVVHVWDETAGWITTSLFKLGDIPVTTLGLLRVVLILTVAWWISYWLRRALKRLGERRDGANLPAFYTIGRLSHYVIILLGFMVGLSSIGVDFTNFALVAGAIAIGIGFGLQSIVNNFVSGLILLFERSLKVGDFIELTSGVAGEVREIKVRSTVINTNDNIDIVVPNSEFMNSNVINWTLEEGFCRIHLPFKVAYGTDKELVRQAGLEAAEKVPHTLYGVPGKNPGIWLVGFADSSLNFELVVWITPRAVKRPGAVRAAYMWEIETALHKHGVEIPFPQRDLHLRTGFGEREYMPYEESQAKI